MNIYYSRDLEIFSHLKPFCINRKENLKYRYNINIVFN